MLLPLLTLAMLATIISVRPPPHLMRGGGAACLAGDRKDSLLLGELHELFFDPGPWALYELSPRAHGVEARLAALGQGGSARRALTERSPRTMPCRGSPGRALTEGSWSRKSPCVASMLQHRLCPSARGRMEGFRPHRRCQLRMHLGEWQCRSQSTGKTLGEEPKTLAANTPERSRRKSCFAER